MTAAIQRTFSGDMGQRLVFVAELLREGEKPDTDKQPLTRQELETLRKIAHMLAQAMAATAQSMEAQVGLISLSKSVGALALSIGRYSAEKSLGIQAKEIRENARDVQKDISAALQRQGGTNDDAGLKQTLLASIQQLKGLEPQGKEGNRVVRIVALRNVVAPPNTLDIKTPTESKVSGAKVIPINVKPDSAGTTVIQPKSTTSPTSISEFTLAKAAHSNGSLPDAKTPAAALGVNSVRADKVVPLSKQVEGNASDRASTITSQPSAKVIATTDKAAVSTEASPLIGQTIQAKTEGPQQAQSERLTVTRNEAAVVTKNDAIPSTKAETTPQVKTGSIEGQVQARTPGSDVKTASNESVTAKGTVDAAIVSKIEAVARTEIKNIAGEPRTENPRTDAPKTETVRAELGKADAVRTDGRAETPRTEAPRSETPRADTPRAETPRAETPRAEAPRAEAPRTETPRAETPRAEAPRAETPRAETPRAETPRAETSRVETPRAEAPRAETPRAEAPRAEAPRAEAPRTETTRAETPRAETPRAEAPRAEAPRTEMPRAEAPRTETPRAEAPRAEAPRAEVRQSEYRQPDTRQTEFLQAEARQSEFRHPETLRTSETQFRQPEQIRSTDNGFNQSGGAFGSTIKKEFAEVKSQVCPCGCGTVLGTRDTSVGNAAKSLAARRNKSQSPPAP